MQGSKDMYKMFKEALDSVDRAAKEISDNIQAVMMGKTPNDLIRCALDEDIVKYIVGVDLGSGPDHTGYIVKTECKQDQGKPRLDLVPLEIVEAIGIVMTKALETYTEGSWRRVERFRFKAAMMRHLLRYMANSKSVAKDSKLPHLWHLATNVAFLISMDWEGEE